MHANNHLFALSARLLPEGKGADWGAAGVDEVVRDVV